MTGGDVLSRALEHHRAGRLPQAAQLYRHILQDDPHHASALHLLGVIALQTGQYSAAVERLHAAVTADQSQTHFRSNLALAYRGLGRLPEAEAALRAAVHLRPDNPELHNNLGTILFELGRRTEAEAAWRETLRLKPDHADAYANLGTLLLGMGRPTEAEAAFRESLRCHPDDAKTHYNLGLAHQALGNLPEAAACWREAIRRNPGHLDAHHNLGTALLELGRPIEAEACLREALRRKPQHAETLLNLGRALLELDRLAEAEIQLQEALRLGANKVKALNNLGVVYQAMGRLSEAEGSLRAALWLDPGHANACHNLGTVLLEQGQLDQAEQQFREALRNDPHHAGAYSRLAVLLRSRLPDSDRTAIERLLADDTLSEASRSALLFGLAHVCDARREYRAAAGHLRQANALALTAAENRGDRYDPVAHARFVDDVIAAFTSDFFRRACSFGVDSELPVFIVGLPRSGTTLVEQILASHSQVHGAGELQLLHEAFDSLPGVLGCQAKPLACLPQFDGAAVAQVAAHYLEKLKALGGNAVRVVDKLPDNYLYLGLIAVLFPRAKLIHCRRDLRDVAVSCWITKFRQIRWANEPGHIRARFADYQRLMNHWKQTLPVSFLDVDYEETVNDLEAVARRLIDWCGLAWDPACLKFHETSRPIRTASATQVRQPIYRHSVGRWKHYESELGDLFASLPLSSCVPRA